MSLNCSMIIRDLDAVTVSMIGNADFEGAIETGEWRFLIALLDRAVKDLREKDICARNSARAWFSYTGPGILGFEEVCDFLGLDSQWVRGALGKASLLDNNFEERLAA